jgi:long-subunit fatty acid transport protein
MTMLRSNHLRRLVTAAAAGTALTSVAPCALASGPLEYPDNGTAAFSRGGAWLATGTDPIAAHYNPAAMATQGSGFSLDLLFAYQSVCYQRRNPGNQPTGPIQETNATTGQGPQYLTACNAGTTQPRILPSLGIVWRASDRLALGFAVVPPATYGNSGGEWPALADARSSTGQTVRQPAPYRYLTVGNRSTIIHPTFSFGYELFKGFRVGAGFIWSLGVIDVETFSIRTVTSSDKGDTARLDTRSRLRTEDLFVPGAVASIHWSLTDKIDVSVWGRWIDAIDASQGRLDLYSQYWNADRNAPQAPCPSPDPFECEGFIVHDVFEKDIFRQFRFRATPPEVRAGVRFHLPRDGAALKVQAGERATRDPLRDDLFDVELNGSYTFNSASETIVVRFVGNPDGTASVPVNPVGNLPPRADRPTGYEDTFGARLGGQYNLVRSKFGIRAGTWYEQAPADPKWLHVAPVPAERGGFGGGLVYRHGSLDISAGYQRHWSSGVDNKGNGDLRANSGVWGDAAEADRFKVGRDPAECTHCSDYQQFRSFHAINGGRVTQSANVFAVGATYRF